jgi:hypothetical protein
MRKEFKYILLGIIILLVLLWWTRYQMVGSFNHVYRLDRLTGKIEILQDMVMTDVVKVYPSTEKTQEVKEAPPPNFSPNSKQN